MHFEERLTADRKGRTNITTMQQQTLRIENCLAQDNFRSAGIAGCKSGALQNCLLNQRDLEQTDGLSSAERRVSEELPSVLFRLQNASKRLRMPLNAFKCLQMPIVSGLEALFRSLLNNHRQCSCHVDSHMYTSRSRDLSWILYVSTSLSKMKRLWVSFQEEEGCASCLVFIKHSRQNPGTFTFTNLPNGQYPLPICTRTNISNSFAKLVNKRQIIFDLLVFRQRVTRRHWVEGMPQGEFGIFYRYARYTMPGTMPIPICMLLILTKVYGRSTYGKSTSIHWKADRRIQSRASSTASSRLFVPKQTV